MSITRCVSSHAMSSLLAWRNPQGQEEGWVGRIQGINNGSQHLGKVISTEIGLLILTTTSIVETVAYGALTLLSVALAPISDRPYKFFAKLLQSSSFTIIWGIADALIYNPLMVNVMTRESFARYWAAMLNPTSIVLFRLEDRLVVTDWEAHHRHHGATIVNDAMLGPILATGRATQETIDQGGTFIAQEVLSGASKETLALFKDMDPTIFMFILTKAIYIFVAGSKKNDDIPDFFKPVTKGLILALRQKLNDEEVLVQLEEFTRNPANFESIPQNKAAKTAFNSLRQIASGELQSSLFTTRCWQKASQMLPK